METGKLREMVLIVAKCIVNLSLADSIVFLLSVLIVAKCIVNHLFQSRVHYI